MKELNKSVRNLFFKSTSSQSEKKIQQFLKKNISPEDIFKKIKNNPDVEFVSRFLFNSGLEKTLLLFSMDRLKKGKPVSWPYVIKIFIKHKLYPSNKIAEILFHNWLKNESSASLFVCEEWGGVSSEFQQMKNVYIQQLEEINMSQENDLLEKLAFVKAQGLVSEEEEIILQLIRINPANKKYKELKQEFEEKKAHFVIQSQKQSLKKTDPLKQSFQQVVTTPVLKKEWLEVIVNQAKKQTELTKNLSLFLYFCECPKQAISLLEICVNQKSDYWYYLNWTLETQQYTKALALVNHLLFESKGTQSMLLPLIYIKAQIFYGLGKNVQAINYLKHINQVFPDYRSTNYLLNKWSESV